MISFSKTGEETQGGTEEKISMERISSVLRDILKKRFPGDFERQRITSRLSGQRLNICCPYCGDSHQNARKKRGNFYTSWLYYKCYNGGCETYVDFLTMAKDFSVEDGLSESERASIRIKIANSKEESRRDRILRHELSLNALTNTNFEEVLVKRKDIVDRLRLQEIHPKSPMGVYLEKRQQTIGKEFAWDPIKKRLFVFNLDPTKEMVFALQTRQFDNSINKYLTYNLSGIWLKIMGCKDEEFMNKIRELDRISTIFGVLRINFNETVTLFEGPLDHFLYPNSVGMCSIENEWPFDVDNTRWFQDNDEAGRKKALSELSEGKSVFLWKKFIDDNSLHGKKLKDLNDIVIYERSNRLDFGDMNKWFSTHKYDGIHL